MARIRLIHWNAGEARSRAIELRRYGHVVNARLAPVPELVRSLAASPPAAIVIDLTRSPSQGRDLGLMLRQRKGTRTIPLVFAGAESEKRRRVRELLPDATYADWSKIGAALKRALTHPLARPIIPTSVIAAYTGRPLARKLGIRPGLEVALLRPPPEFLPTLGPLPDGVRVRRGRPRGADVGVWFARTPDELGHTIGVRAAGLGLGVVWIAWRKGGSAAAGQLTQALVRKAGLAAGLVDYKICSIDAVWSALLFKHR